MPAEQNVRMDTVPPRRLRQRGAAHVDLGDGRLLLLRAPTPASTPHRREGSFSPGYGAVPFQLPSTATRRCHCYPLHKAAAGQSASNLLRKAANLSPAEVNLLREGHGVDLPRDAGQLARAIKATQIRLTAARSLERAISSAGGVSLAELDEGLMIRRLPGIYAVGEMLDWEAPTGGYLLQACFATGVAAARAILTRAGA